jgi:hypothetical protein
MRQGFDYRYSSRALFALAVGWDLVRRVGVATLYVESSQGSVLNATATGGNTARLNRAP